MEQKKFEIEGDIEDENGNGKKIWAVVSRFALFLLLVGVILSVVYFPLLQDAFPGLRKVTLGQEPANDTLFYQYQRLKYSFDSLQQVNDSLQQSILQITPEPQPSTSPDIAGLSYEIQVGALKDFSVNDYRDGLVNLNAEELDGYQKITLGRFRNEEVAGRFLKEVRKMGFKDAWIVARQDGVRVPYNRKF